MACLNERSSRLRWVENRSKSAILLFGRPALREDAPLADLQAREFPLRHGHLLEPELLGPALRLPLGFQVSAELLVLLGVLAGKQDATGAQAVAERVQARDSLTIRCDRTRRQRRVAAIRRMLLF